MPTWTRSNALEFRTRHPSRGPQGRHFRVFPCYDVPLSPKPGLRGRSQLWSTLAPPPPCSTALCCLLRDTICAPPIACNYSTPNSPHACGLRTTHVTRDLLLAAVDLEYCLTLVYYRGRARIPTQRHSNPSSLCEDIFTGYADDLESGWDAFFGLSDPGKSTVGGGLEPRAAHLISQTALPDLRGLLATESLGKPSSGRPGEEQDPRAL